MKRAALLLAVTLCTGGLSVSAQQPAAATARDLVGTWTLAAIQRGDERPSPAPNTRGLLVFDAAGHMIEVVMRGTQQPIAGVSDAQARFLGFGGSWGGYSANLREKKIVYKPAGAVSPNVMGTEFARSFALDGDLLTITSLPGEPHTPAVTRWTWERVPNVENLSAGYRKVIGFWEHVVEQRLNGTTVISESRRAPSVIVYTPAGYVGVHFPPLNRPKFAGAEPTDAEARAALMGYVGYFGALAVYPGQVFHHIMAGLSPATGTTLKRSYELSGNNLTIRFTPSGSLPGEQASTLVTLRRLSGEAEMLGR